MTPQLRYSNKYRRTFAEIVPRFQLLEIEPIFKEIGYTHETPLTVVDVGANGGIWSLALLQHSGPWIGKIHMFEPMEGNLASLRQVMKDGLYGEHVDKLVINEYALSDDKGSVEIHFENDVTGLASIDSGTAHFPMRNIPLDRTRSIKTDRLDTYCAENGIESIDILKIDVEGHELAVLKGAENLFRENRVKAVAYEIGPHQMARRDFYKDFFEFFEQYGYTNLRYREPGWKAMPIPEYRSSLEQFDNVCMRMAVRTEKPVDAPIKERVKAWLKPKLGR